MNDSIMYATMEEQQTDTTTGRITRLDYMNQSDVDK